MKYLSRPFITGDEFAIIDLYYSITGTKRSLLQYKWEWLNTWNGQGSIWVMIDPSKQKNHMVVCQYSLIPTPIYFFGDSTISGKTENCMSHIDLRGKRIYFPFEKKCFGIAKSRFSLFFTTTGKGAPGRVRRKLGYIPIGNWKEFYYFNDVSSLTKFYWNAYFSKIAKNFPKYFLQVIRMLNHVFSRIKFLFTRNVAKSRIPNVDFKFSSILDFDFLEIEQLWKKNKSHYSITIDRTKQYLEWRLKANPYLQYNIQSIYQDESLVAYLIYYVNSKNLIVIEDLLVDKMNQKLALNLLNELRIKSIDMKSSGISFSFLEGNEFLNNLFSKSFFSLKSYRFISKFIKKVDLLDKHFLAYCTDKDKLAKVSQAKNWYVTGLFREGVQ